jgi:hypothetical protein
VLDIGVTSLNQLCVGVVCLLLELVDLQRSDRHEFESPFVGVEPAPFFQGVFKVQTKTETLFAIAVHVTSEEARPGNRRRVSVG